MKFSGKWITALVIVFISISFAAIASDPPLTIKPGIWKGVLHRTDGNQIIFNFEAKRVQGKPVLYVINGKEKLLVDSISQIGDSLSIVMPFFNSRFVVKSDESGNLNGYYFKDYAKRVEYIPFTAIFGVKERYRQNTKPSVDVSGRWATTFFQNSGDSIKAVGEFVQAVTGKLTGTFLVGSGDYRYLEGWVVGDSLFLSRFDGGSAILFAGKVTENHIISGAFQYSGLKNKITWGANRDENAKLPDGYAQVKMKGGQTKLDFRFPSTTGDTVSVNDDRYKNKVVIVQILGSWCPNCMDETAFLSEYYDRNKSKGLEVIGLAYERTADYDVSKKSLEPFRRRFKVNYPFLITNVTITDSLRTEKTLPQMENIEAFPTSIFIDRKGMVRKIHSGYDGPATGAHYEAFKKEFEELVSGLLKESGSL